MAERRDYVALDWISGEIDETLKQACQALEAYVTDTQDITKLRFCMTYINQVYGTLRMVEFHGAALFAREVELLIQAMLDAEVRDNEQAVEAIMAGLLHLPSYLDQVRSARQDLPGILLPRINDMRAIRSEELMSEVAFFSPELSAVQPSGELAPELDAEAFQEQVAKLRQMFQLAFVGIVRKKQLGQNLEYLAKVCQRLREMSQGKTREPLWRVAIAIIEGLANQSIHPNAAVKSLLKEIDGELKALQQHGVAWFDQQLAPELLKSFLYYVARSDADSPNIKQVQNSYRLKEALAQSVQTDNNSVDPDALRSVVDALLEELAAIKDYLDLYGRSNDKDIDNIKETLPLIKRVGDTMAVLGFVEPLARIRTQAQVLGGFADAGNVDDSGSLLAVAEAIIAVEEDLQGYLAPSGKSAGDETPHLDAARETVLRETRGVLEHAKEAIIDFVASQWDHSRLEAVPAILHELSASLGMVGLDRPALVLDACEHYVNQSLLQDNSVPDWQMLDKLADAISGVDYYLERAAEDQQADNEDILDIAAASVAELGYAIESLADLDLSTVARQEQPVDQQLDEVVEAHTPALAEEQTTDELAEIIDLHPEPELEPQQVDAGEQQQQDIAEPASAMIAHAVEAVTEEPLDEEIAEIFVEEAGEVLETIAQNLPQWQAQLDDEHALSELRRAFHTLKGSGRMVGANMLGELAWSVETMLNKIVEHSMSPACQHGVMVEKVSAMVPAMVTAFEKLQPLNKLYVDSVMAMGMALTDGEEVADLDSIDAKWLDPEAAGSGVEQAEAEEDVVAADLEAATVESEDNAQQRELAANTAAEQERQSEQSERDALLEIFDAEAQQHLTTMQDFILQAEASGEPVLVSDSLQRALHTLKGCTRMAGIDALGAIVTPLEQLIKQLQAARVEIDSEVIEAIRDTTCLAFIGLTFVRDSGECAEFSETPSLLARIDRIGETHVPAPGEQDGDGGGYLARVGEFMIDTSDNLESVSAILSRWSDAGEVADSDWFIISDYSARIADAAAELELAPIANLSRAWSQAATRLNESAPSEDMVSAFEHSCSSLESMLDALAADQSFDEVDERLLQALETLQPVVADDASEMDVPDEQCDAGAAAIADAQIEEQAQQREAAVSADAEDFDDEMVEMFKEEAPDLLENLDETIHRWLDDRQDRGCFELLQRTLHTLKGGARLADLGSLGNLSHNFETFLMAVDERGLPFDDAFFAIVQQYQDKLVAVLGQLMAGRQIEDIAEQGPDALVDSLKPVEMMDVPVTAQAQPGPEVAPLQSADMSQSRANQEAVKVPAQLIEQLVNLAGETSINRGRVEEQISEVMFSLAEMDATMDRMQEQLRRLDIETEQQLIFRQGQVESLGLEEFDPLEMDRYSVLQQLSRSLQESSSDIKEVKGSIFNKARDMETLLLQQSRINTDLQEGLMRSRMVPFARMVPRLRRIVRQVSVELGKNVNLELLNTEGEMDRTILERMVPSFEHMLRNAVDHGIESEADRSAANKSATGKITISLAREAGDVVITLADDGRGIDLEAVRSKAIERGMMAADASLSDHQVLQFILQSGFSTAQAVTQISGRGVGLDVVASEIKQIGGSVDIESNMGRGTRFVIRLPFTVSVNRALMVETCGETYALPLNTIEGIVRVSPFELESYYQPDAPLFEYAGQFYKLRYMGALIRKKAMPDLEQETMPLPVILVRSGEHSFAIQVDSLLGSREIVVKTLGPQFSSVQGLSGATVLGDGGVVVILDLHAMIRTDISLPQLNALVENERESEKTEENRNLLVMVVDDSVTVRKVTSRFLERNGMDVLLAKDGVDAMQLLQDHKPDVMLLDIEMPRMDGFEVASRVKHSSKLKHLPIIMITSRTGEKHRERAESIGVDKYLGKPYQELELLGNIQDLTGFNG